MQLPHMSWQRRHQIDTEMTLSEEAVRSTNCSTKDTKRTGFSEMQDTKLEKMSAKELAALGVRLSKTIGAKAASERDEVRRKVEQVVHEAGFRLSDLFGKGAGRKGQKVAPKYCNPKNPAETWTGRGRKPRWVVQAGGDLKRFLIK